MKEVEKVVKATVNGEAQEHVIKVSIPEDLGEASDQLGEDGVYTRIVRTLITDACNAERVAMKGGEAKVRRKAIKDLVAKLLEDPDLLAKVERKTGVSL